ncbi:unnamed protein product [Rhizopus microsporus]
MESNAAFVRRQERNSILKKYYGINGKVVNNQAVVEERPFDLDADTFNSSKYFANLLKEKTLRELMEADNSLVAEIREIDGDMKTLVYENYNKFISATDTIRKMRSNVESMESEMSKLKENITTISNQSKRINETLSPNRTKIQQLSTAHNSLKRLQFLFDLPSRLQHYLNRGKYLQAIQYYAKAKRLLNNTAAFKGIEEECNVIMEKVKQDIWSQLQEREASLETVAENTRLLVLLGENKSRLCREYIDIQTKALQRKQSKQAESSTVDDMLSNFIIPLEDIVNHFDHLFLTRDDLDSAEKEEAKQSLLDAIQPFIDAFFALVKTFMQLPNEIPDDSPKQMDYLCQLKDAISSRAVSLDSITGISKRMDVFGANWKNELINKIFRTAIDGVRDRVQEFIKEIKMMDKDTDRMIKFIQDTQAWLTDHVTQSCLLPLKTYFAKESPDRVRHGLRLVWEDITKVFQSVVKNVILDRHLLQIVMLAISRLCYDLADNSVYQTYTIFSYEFYIKTQEVGYRAPSLDPAVIPDMNAVIEQCLNIGQSLLNQQIVYDGYRLSTRVQEAYLFREPSSVVNQVSSIWITIFQQLKQIEVLMSALFPQQQQEEKDKDVEDEASATLSTATEGVVERFGIDMMMNYSIDKLFAERIEVYRKLEPTPASVYHGLVIILLKAFLEVTRQIQMDTVMFQQIQVDVEYIGRMVWSFAGEEKWVITLLQETISSAYTRCESPSKLSLNELDIILSLK